MVEITSPAFKDNAAEALSDAQLQKAMRHVKSNFIDKRAKAAAALPEFDDLRDSARDIKDHVLDNLDLYLEAYEQKVTASGGHVHWAADAVEARGLVLDICRKANARTVTKGKSMITEEIGLNDFLRKQRHHAGRDRPWRIHHPASRRASEPHHRPGRPSQHGPGARGFPQGAYASAGRPADVRAAKPAAGGARRAAREIPQGRCRHHRRQLPHRRDRLVGHRHQ